MKDSRNVSLIKHKKYLFTRREFMDPFTVVLFKTFDEMSKRKDSDILSKIYVPIFLPFHKIKIDDKSTNIKQGI